MTEDEELDAFEAEQYRSRRMERMRKGRACLRDAERVANEFLALAKVRETRAVDHVTRAHGWRKPMRSLRAMWCRHRASQCRVVAANVTEQGHVTNGDWLDLSRYR